MEATDKHTGLTWDRLNDLLDIYPESGHFVWKSWRGGNAHAGTLAGSMNNSGYLLLRIDGQQYLNHRLMWFYIHKRWPENDIDHVNLDRIDNRICNLREATRSQNVANGLVRRDSGTGVRGVKKMENRYGAFVTKDGVREYLGLFDTPSEAQSAYATAAQRLFGEFART